MPGASSTTLPATASNSKGSKQILDKSRTHNTLQLNQDTQQAITQQKQQRPSLSSRSQDEAWVDISDRRLPNTRLGALYPGSKFVGSQECEAKSYQVTVEIQHVDLREGTLTGYLNIKGLTVRYPELTTFFQGEIIGPKYSFLTRKWQAQRQIDAVHWKRFPSFKPYADKFHEDGFVYNSLEEDFVYMRWKEHFLVPDHHLINVQGASFAGFYYICYQRSTGEISGFYYFHEHLEWYQKLKLRHQTKDRCFGSFEFR